MPALSEVAAATESNGDLRLLLAIYATNFCDTTLANTTGYRKEDHPRASLAATDGLMEYAAIVLS